MKKVAVIGGGVTGLEAASQLAQLGYTVRYLKKSTAGGHVSKWDRLFLNRRHSFEVVNELKSLLNGNPAIYLSTSINKITQKDNRIQLEAYNQIFEADAVPIATGFELFPAERKEEYGYGIYDNVITSAVLEGMFKEHGHPIMRNGNTPNSLLLSTAWAAVTKRSNAHTVLGFAV